MKLRSEFVFPNRAWKALNVNWVTKALWPRLVEKSEVPYRPLMQTRHTYATLMLQKGAPINWLQKQMGHRNLTMLIRHYWRWINPGELSQETLARLGAVKTRQINPTLTPPAPIRAFRERLDDDAQCQKVQQFGGEGGIRTLGTGYPVRQISNLVPSTTRPPLRSMKSSIYAVFALRAISKVSKKCPRFLEPVVRLFAVRRQNFLDKLAMDLREDLVHLG